MNITESAYIHPLDEAHFHTDRDNPLLLRTSNFIPVPDNQPDIDHLSPGFEKFMIVFDIVSCITGITGNVFTIIIVAASKKLRTTNNMFVAHLAGVDLLICGVVVPYNLYSMLSGNGHSYYCEVFGPLIVGVMVMSLLSLANIALNRYFLVCREPQIYAKIYTNRNILLNLVACYIYTIILLMPPFAGLSRWAEHTKFRTCIFTAYDSNSFIYGIGILTIFAFLPPASICLFSYYSIIKKFRESRAKFSKVTPTATTSTGDTELSGEVEEDQPTTTEQSSRTKSSYKVKNREGGKERSKADRKTFRAVIGMILVFVVFLLCWVPVILVFAIDYQGKSSAEAYVTAIAIAWLNSSINIFLYAGLNSNYKKAYKLLVTFKWKELRNY